MKSYANQMKTVYLDQLDIKSDKIFGERSVNISGQKTVDLLKISGEGSEHS